MKQSGQQPVFRYVDCVQFYVTDLEKGIEYYCRQLGLRVIWKTERAVGLGMAEDQTEIVLQNERAAQEIDIKVESVDEALKTWKEAGGKVLAGPFDISIGKCAVVQDPWGNQYVLLDSSKGTFITDEAGNIIGQTAPS